MMNDDDDNIVNICNFSRSTVTQFSTQSRRITTTKDYSRITYYPTVNFMLQSLLTLLVHRVKSGSRHLVCGTLSINVILSRLQQNNCTNSTASKQRLLTAAATLMLDSNLSTAPIHIHITEFHCLFISVYPTLFILITFCILCTAVHPLQVVAVMFVTKVMPHCSKKCPTLWAVCARLSVSMCDIKKCLWLQQTHGGQVPACTCTCMNQHVSVPVYTCTTMYMHVPVCTCTCVYLYLCIPVPLCTCMYLHQCVSVPVYTCTTVYMCVPVPVCTCIWRWCSSRSDSLSRRRFKFSCWSWTMFDLAILMSSFISVVAVCRPSSFCCRFVTVALTINTVQLLKWTINNI